MYNKHFKVMDTVILGYSENPFSILVGTMINKKIKALANVEFGFKPEEAFRQIAKHIATKVELERDMIWLEPRLHCKVQYLEKTNSGLLS
ncbi:hypothetical protein C7Y47_24300 [Lysinibacillus sphaericus]|uniref:Uncharacterized protein n=1 Tax=Lysinibacillus sphaericus TaxID=1421 RepID=A0A544U767_LYSSH|nr:hypothetical protein [Lysinibacillus sp. SDF0037]TQR26667.1 hypothetical protein C7Y47_24300 [Lysinibacillus sp. SDF0037]